MENPFWHSPGAIAALLTPGAPVARGTPTHWVSYPSTLQSQNVISNILYLEQRISDLAIINADIYPSIKTPPSLQRLTSSLCKMSMNNHTMIVRLICRHLPRAGAELHNLRDVTQEASPAWLTVTVIGEVTAPIDTAGVSYTRVTRVPRPAELTSTRAWFWARAVHLAARVWAHRLVTQLPRPALVTVTLQGGAAGPVQTARGRGALTAVLAPEPRLTLTLPRGHTLASLPALLTLGHITEHPAPARLAVTGEALGAVPVLAARQLHAVSAAGALVAQVTLALAWLHAVSVLGVTVVTTHGHLGTERDCESCVT